MIAFVKMRQLEVDDKYSLRGQTLANAIEVIVHSGLWPYARVYVCMYVCMYISIGHVERTLKNITNIII